MPIRKILYLSGGILILGAIFFVFNAAVPAERFSYHSLRFAGVKQPVSFSPFLEIDGVVIPVELATTSAALQKGLSGRETLAADQGMLFIFSRPGRYRFWMPGMNFPIDIVWVQNGRVVDIDENVSNEFDPANPKFYTSEVPAQYVLEVNAGFSRIRGINIGDAVNFNLKE